MFVSKKKFEKLQSECDSYRATVEAREREVHYWEDGHHKLAKRLIATENTLKDAELVRDVYKRDVDELGALLETLEQDRDYWLNAHRNEAGRVERLTSENEGLVAEGARLADELAAMRKAVKAGSPVIDGMRIEYDDGSSKVVAGCTAMRGFPYAPEGWLVPYAGDNPCPGQFATHGVRAIRPVLIESKATEKQPTPKKKAVATKKAGRK